MTGVQISENGADDPQALLHVGPGSTAPTVSSPILFGEGNAEFTGLLRAASINSTA